MQRKLLTGILMMVAVMAVAFAGAATVYAAPINVANESQLRAAVAQAGAAPTTIALTADIELVSNFIIPEGANITLTSAGNTMHSLIATRDMPVIEIQRNGVLTIENIGVVRQSDTRGYGIRINYGTLYMNSGTVSGHDRVGVGSELGSGSLTMNGGIINDNIIGVSVGTFVMNDGIIGRSASNGVRISGSGIMNGGTIHNNLGGGVRGNNFTMNSGTISGNSATWAQGGGVDVSTFTMNGGIISGNSHDGDTGPLMVTGAGGVRAGAFTMNGGIISGNITNASGGGVTGGTFVMNGGIISGNTALRGSGGVHMNGTFIMNGGIISGNTADNGGGVGLDSRGTFTMNRGTIRDNTATDNGGGVNNNGTFTFNGGWIFNNSAPTGTDLNPGGTFHNNVFDLNIGGIGSAPPAGAALTVAIVTGTPVTSPVLVNGQSVNFQAYNIGGNSFFRLRDIAYALNGTAAQFNVGWDGAANAITLTRGAAYVPVGGELAGESLGNVAATPASAVILLDGRQIAPAAYNIGGSNYFMLRALGAELGFSVGWDAATNSILINTR